MQILQTWKVAIMMMIDVYIQLLVMKILKAPSLFCLFSLLCGYCECLFLFVLVMDFSFTSVL